MNRIILFFDSSCGLCHHSVAWLYKKDTKRVFYFAPLSGETAKELLKPEYWKMDSVVLYEAGAVSVEAQAVFRSLRYLGGIWKLLSYVPAAIFNPIYRMIAAKRKNIPLAKLNLPDERMLP